MQGKIVHERATRELLSIFKLEDCGLEHILSQSTWKGLLNGCVILTSDSSNSSYLVSI